MAATVVVAVLAALASVRFSCRRWLINTCDRKPALATDEQKRELVHGGDRVPRGELALEVARIVLIKH